MNASDLLYTIHEIFAIFLMSCLWFLIFSSMYDTEDVEITMGLINGRKERF